MTALKSQINENKSLPSLHAALGLTPGGGPVALLGGGGKTTALFALAREAAALGLRACLLTTTHIRPPREADVALFTDLDGVGAATAAAMERAWARGLVVSAGQLLDDGRMAAPAAAVYSYLLQQAQAVYVEADGSKGLPLKYPAAWEPALPPQARRVLLLCGLSALDQPLDQVCHRAALARERLGLAAGPDAAIVDEDLMARILAAGYAKWQPRVVLNQADDERTRTRGAKTARLLAGYGLTDCRVVSLKQLTAKQPPARS